VHVGVLDRFEKGVERAVSGAFAKAFRSEVKPVEIASAVRRQMDDRAAAVTRERTVVPNQFVVELSEEDLEQIRTWGEEALAEEIVSTAMEHATRQHYTFVGPVTVRFVRDDALEKGRFVVRSATVRGAVAPVTAATASPRHPILDIDGQRYLLTGTVTTIGRGSDADIVVDDPGISRKHLEIRVTPDGVIATDLGSTNGTYVEGNSITAATLVDGNSLTIGRTRILFWTGAAEDDDE
jgi:hypothetical protein